MNEFTINVKVSGEVHIPELAGLIKPQQPVVASAQKPPFPTPAVGAPLSAATVPSTTPAPTQTSFPSNPAPIAPAPTAAPTAAPTYSIEDITRAGALLAQQGPDKLAQLSGLLQKFSLASVTDLKPEQMGAFVTELRGLGANI